MRWRGFPLLAGTLLAAGCASADRDAQETEIALSRTARGEVRSGPGGLAPGGASDRPRHAPDAELDALLAREPARELVLDAVARRNPDVLAALERWVAHLERVPQRTSLPFPTLRYGFSSMFKMHTASLLQELPFPTKLVTEGHAALAEARAMRAEHDERANVLREQADRALAGLYLARRELEIVEENVKLLDRFVEVAKAKLVAGRASQSDLLRAEVERDGLRADRAALARQVEIAKSTLNVLLDRDPDATLGAVPSLPRPTATVEPELLARSPGRRPEVVAARERTLAAEARVSRARQEWVPDLVVGGGYVRDAGMGRDRYELMGGISLPVWVPRILAGVREAEAELRRADAEARSTENRVLDEVRSARAALQGAAERFAILADDALPKARQNVKASEAAYTSGKIDFLALVDAQRMLLEKELETERARAESVVRRAELERAVGGRRER